MQQYTKKFMEGVESKILNSQKPIYNNSVPENIYCSAFGDDNYMDDPSLPYGDKISDANMDEISKSYIDVIDNYIITEASVPVKDSIPLLSNKRKLKIGNQGNPIGK